MNDKPKVTTPIPEPEPAYTKEIYCEVLRVFRVYPEVTTVEPCRPYPTKRGGRKQRRPRPK